MRKTLLLFCCFFTLSSISPATILASIPGDDEKYPPHLFRVSPVIVQITLSPGKTTTHTITVENLTDAPLPLHASLEGFDAADEDGAITVSTPENTAPLASWIRLDTADLLLNPWEKQETVLTVTIPKDVTVGGYYAVLFFTPLLPQDGETRTPRFISKVGVLLLGTIGVQNTDGPQVRLPAFQFGSLFQEKNPADLLLRVQNISLSHLSVKPVLQIRPLYAPQQVIDLPEKVILPGKIRRWQEQIALNPANRGFYRITLLVSTGGGRHIKQEMTLLLFPWKKTILLLFLFSLFLWSTRHRIRLKQAVRAFWNK